MEVSRKVSLSISSSSSSVCSGIETDNGFKSDICYRQAFLQMDESLSKSTVSHPPNIKIEDDDTSNKGIHHADGSADKKTQESSTSLARGCIDTIPAESESTKNAEGISISKSSKGISIKIKVNAQRNSESSDDAKIKRSSDDKKKIIDIDDTIASVAASFAFRPRRRKRERSNYSPESQELAPCSRHYIPTINRPPTIVTASMNNHYVPPRLVVGASSSKGDGSSRNKSCDKGAKNRLSVHMLNSVGLECGDDGKLLLERFEDDDTASLSIYNVDGAGPIKTEGETGGKSTLRVKKQKPPMWTLEQHKTFVAAIFEIGLKNCSPSIIMENMRKQPRYITRERTKSHLQKYRQTKERSKGDFLKEFDDFFRSTENARAMLEAKTSNSSADDNEKSSTNKSRKHKEPIPKIVLTAALEGRKPSKLLCGKAAALLSYSVLNGFSTNHGPDQLQYKAAKLSEFPSLTEEEKRSSVGASLLQVKSLIDNMTDILLKTRHGIKPLPVQRSEIGGGVSDSSICSSDDGYSDEDEDNTERVRSLEKNMMGKTTSKDQDQMAAPTVPPNPVGPFPIGTVPVGPTHPMYRGPPTVYPAPFPTQGAPPAVAPAFPPPQYPQAQPLYYGGTPPHLQPTVAPAFGGHSGFHHPPMRYTQDPRVNPYQQAPPPTQVGAYPAVPPLQPNYYPAVATYHAYYGNNGEGIMDATQSTVNPEYPHSNEVFSNHIGHRSDIQRTNSYDQQASSYTSDGRSDRRTCDSHDSTKEKRSRGRPEKRSKHCRITDYRETLLSTNSSDFQRTDDEIGDFLDRIEKIPSPDKSSQNPSSSPIKRSRREGRYKSPPPILSEDSLIETSTVDRSRHLEEQNHPEPQRQYQPQFDALNSHAKKYSSPEVEHYSEVEGSRFSNAFEVSQVHRAPSARSQNQPHVDRQHHSNRNGQFWESSNFGESSYNNQVRQPDAGEGEFAQQPARLHSFSRSEQQQESGNYDIVNDQQHENSEASIYIKSAQSSPDARSANNYFFGE